MSIHAALARHSLAATHCDASCAKFLSLRRRFSRRLTASHPSSSTGFLQAAPLICFARCHVLDATTLSY